MRVIARGTPGFSGADLANLVNEAALLAARFGKRVVTMSDFEQAKDKVLMGAERRSMVMTDEEKLATAYHETGHAIVNLELPECDPLHKVTIIPRGRALGVTMALPEKRAKALLSSGRTLTVTGTFRIAGLGTRAVTLADPATTTVEALGVRTRMRSFRMTHVKPTVAHLFAKIMRPLFRSLDETSWLAPGRESVRTDWADDGSVLTETQVGCG